MTNEFLHVDHLDGLDLVGEMRKIHRDAVFPWWWEISTGPHEGFDPDNHALAVTVGPATCLSWSEGQRVWSPANGTGETAVEARMAGGLTTYMEPGSQVAPDTVFAALTEFLTTRQRPTCVEWRPWSPS